jgi:hypothetical protein
MDYLIHQYLKKSFQKVSLHLLQHNLSDKKYITSNDIQKWEEKFITQVKKSILQRLIHFVRCSEILENINKNISLSTEYSQINLFLLPDILITKNQYYHNLLLYSSSICSKQIINLNNEDSKMFISKIG